MPPSFSIIVPVYNEEQRIHKTFASITTFYAQGYFPNLEIVFVDDGSKDRTADLVRGFTCPAKVRLVTYGQNRGKGHAVKRGMLEATGGI